MENTRKLWRIRTPDMDLNKNETVGFCEYCQTCPVRYGLKFENAGVLLPKAAKTKEFRNLGLALTLTCIDADLLFRLDHH